MTLPDAGPMKYWGNYASHLAAYSLGFVFCNHYAVNAPYMAGIGVGAVVALIAILNWKFTHRPESK